MCGSRYGVAAVEVLGVCFFQCFLLKTDHWERFNDSRARSNDMRRQLWDDYKEDGRQIEDANRMFLRRFSGCTLKVLRIPSMHLT